MESKSNQVPSRYEELPSPQYVGGSRACYKDDQFKAIHIFIHFMLVFLRPRPIGTEIRGPSRFQVELPGLISHLALPYFACS